MLDVQHDQAVGAFHVAQTRRTASSRLTGRLPSANSAAIRCGQRLGVGVADRLHARLVEVSRTARRSR